MQMVRIEVEIHVPTTMVIVDKLWFNSWEISSSPNYIKKENEKTFIFICFCGYNGNYSAVGADESSNLK